MTAVYQGTNPRTGSSVLLRSYDSRKEPPPEFNCTIWQAGRATCATGLAFKPIQIGMSTFSDEGAGQYNPSISALEETVAEWPARDVGVFVSVGTGKRPSNTNMSQHEWWEGVGNMGMFADARRMLMVSRTTDTVRVEKWKSERSTPRIEWIVVVSLWIVVV